MRKDEPTPAPQIVTIVGRARKPNESFLNAILCVAGAAAFIAAVAYFGGGGDVSPSNTVTQAPPETAGVAPNTIAEAPVVEPRPLDDEAAIAAAIADFTARGWIYDYRVNPTTRTLRLAVPPGVVADGYGNDAIRTICGRLWFHGVNTIGGQRPIVRLVRQINDLSAIATDQCL